MKAWMGAVVLALGVPALGADEVSFHVRLRQSRDGFLVRQAVRGAHRRLSQPGCQKLFSDFTDASGRPLQAVLDERGDTGQGHLRRLLFYDGAETPGCRAGVLAFTQPGSHVIQVCTPWFREAFTTNPTRVEAAIIHESLHTLGLGEDPPSSREITARVLERCFR